MRFVVEVKSMVVPSRSLPVTVSSRDASPTTVLKVMTKLAGATSMEVQQFPESGKTQEPRDILVAFS